MAIKRTILSFASTPFHCTSFRFKVKQQTFSSLALSVQEFDCELNRDIDEAQPAFVSQGSFKQDVQLVDAEMYT